MGRVYGDIRVNGKKLHTLYDTGARGTYVRATAAKHFKSQPLPKKSHFRAELGGASHEVARVVVLLGEIDGHPFNTMAYVLDDIGKDELGRPIDVLFGALSMQQWSIRPVPDEERLDLSHFTREFVEF